MSVYSEIIQKNQSSLVYIKVVDKRKQIDPAIGSGVSISKEGYVITARHNIENYLENSDRFEILVVNLNENTTDIIPTIRHYKIAVLNYIQLTPEAGGMHLDIVGLTPITPFACENYAQADIQAKFQLGEELIMGGYSRELNICSENLLDIKRNVDAYYPTTAEGVKSTICEIYQLKFQSPFFKRAIIANQYEIILGGMDNPTNPYFNYIYLDNIATEGMSGGPIFNMAGYVVGIIIQKTTVSTPLIARERNATTDNMGELADIEVPAGCALGISIKALTL